MALPDSRSTTYVANTTPAIKAADLNDLQDFIVDHHRILRGTDFYMFDDFTGDVLDVGKWLPDVNVLISNLGGAENAIGFAESNNAQIGAILTRFLNLGTTDWRIIGRFRLHNYTDAVNAITQFGAISATAAQDCHFTLRRTNVATFNIEAQVGAAAAVDLGVAVPNASHAVLEIRRIGGQVSFWKDGVNLYSTAYATSQTDVNMGLYKTDTASASSFRCDFIKIWALR